MLGSQALETAVGLALVFGTFALIASGLRETIEALLQTRAIGLERAVRLMLGDGEGEGAARALFAHPLIAGLYRGGYDPARLRPDARGGRRLPFGSRLPAYLPAHLFASALTDIAQGKGAAPAPGAVATMLAEAGGDDGLLRERIERWFDDAMERASGWYRKQTQLVLCTIGLVLAVGCNLDALAMARAFYADDAVRAALVAEAAREPACTDGSCAAARIAALPLPIGWQSAPRAMPWDALPGWLLSALAIAAGAPFWFDVLARVTAVRSTVKPRAAEALFEPHRWTDRTDPHEGLL